MRWIVEPSRLSGRCRVPGDKSIAHRALMFAAIAGEESTIEGLPSGEDVGSTARCVQSLGARVERLNGAAHIVPEDRLRAPEGPLDAGNSGTTMRLLAGILAGQPFTTQLSGDDSLRRRPMGRVVEPLVRMGATILTQDGRAPLVIQGSRLQGIEYTLPVASAQVKSCILLAGLFAQSKTTVFQPQPTRDHTERMLRATGVPVEVSGDAISVEPGRPRGFQTRVPGDISSGAFLLAVGALTGGQVTVDDVGVNPTRAGFLAVLTRMGAGVELSDEREQTGEPVGSVTVSASDLRPVTVEGEEIPLLVDELPLVCLLATQARGISVIRGAAELRHKESDRIATVANSLRAMGADIDELADGWVVRGPAPLRGASVRSHGDHRVGMMLAVAGAIAGGKTVIEEADAASISFPEFGDTFVALDGRLLVEAGR